MQGSYGLCLAASAMLRSPIPPRAQMPEWEILMVHEYANILSDIQEAETRAMEDIASLMTTPMKEEKSQTFQSRTGLRYLGIHHIDDTI